MFSTVSSIRMINKHSYSSQTRSMVEGGQENRSEDSLYISLRQDYLREAREEKEFCQRLVTFPSIMLKLSIEICLLERPYACALQGGRIGQGVERFEDK